MRLDFVTRFRLADLSEEALHRLIDFQIKEDYPCIAIIAYYKALHIIDAVAAKEENLYFEDHTARLDYLTKKSLPIKRSFDRLYVLFQFVGYGHCVDADMLRHFMNMLHTADFVQVIRSWLSAVERIR
jgi:hypothetical protein